MSSNHLPQLFPDREAAAVVRGFLTQAYWTVLRWFDLRSDEVLICEGDDDIVRLLLDHQGIVKDITQEQIKDVHARLSARTPIVHDTLFAFAVAFHEHAIAGRTCRFVFTTSAAIAAQRVNEATIEAKAPPPLGVDILKSWCAWANHRGVEQTSMLVLAFRQLVAGYATEKSSESHHQSSKSGRTSSLTPQRIRNALKYLDETTDAWEAFLGAVQWNFEQPSEELLRQQIVDRVCRDPRTTNLPSAIFACRLIITVLITSAKRDIHERSLRKSDLDALTSESSEELARWTDRTRAKRIDSWRQLIEDTIAEHKNDIADIKQRLAVIEKPSEPVLSADARDQYRTWALSAISTFRIVGAVRPLDIEHAWPLQAKWVGTSKTSFEGHRLLEAEESRVFLVGTGGAGKTTLLKRLARTELMAGGIAVLVSLRLVGTMLAQGATFLSATARCVADVRGCDEHEARAIVTGASVLLFDGLDEVRESLETIRQALETYAADRKNLRIVVTARRAEDSNDILRGFRVAELEPIRQYEAEEHVRRILPLLLSAGESVEEALSGFRALDRRRRIESTPLNLTILVQIARNGITTVGTRAQMYDLLVRKMQQRRTEDRVPPSVSPSVARAVLDATAWVLSTEPNSELTPLVERVLGYGRRYQWLEGNAKEVEAAFRFWEDRAVLLRSWERDQEQISFIHESFREFCAGTYLGRLPCDIRRDWFTQHVYDRRFREVILFAHAMGGNDVRDDLVSMTRPEEPAGLLLLAEAAQQGESIDASLARTVAERVAPHLTSSVPIVAWKVAEAIVPLVALASDAFVGAAKAALNGPGSHGSWNELAALHVLLAANDPDVPVARLLDIISGVTNGSLPFDGPRDWGVEQTAVNTIIVAAFDFLLRRGPRDRVISLISELVLSERHISAAAHFDLWIALKGWGLDELNEQYRSKQRARSPSERLFREKLQSWLADIAFLGRLARIVGPSNTTVGDVPRTESIGRLIGGMKWLEAPDPEWTPGIFIDPRAAVDEVLRGMIGALGIDPQQLATEVEAAFGHVVPRKPPSADAIIYRGLRWTQVASPNEPDWYRALSPPPAIDPLLDALDLGSTVFPTCAAQLLAHHPDQAGVLEGLRRALRQPREGLVWFAGIAAPSLWPDQAEDLLVEVLTENLDETTATLLEPLTTIARNELRACKLIAAALASNCGNIVQAGATAAQEYRGAEAAIFDEVLRERFWHWLAWGEDASSPLVPKREGFILCGTTSHAEMVAETLLKVLVARSRISTEEVMELACRRSVGRTAAGLLAKLAGSSPEVLRTLVTRLNKGGFSSRVLWELLELPASVLSTVHNELFRLHIHPEPAIRKMLVCSFARPTWLSSELAIAALNARLEDEDPEVRSAAAQALAGDVEHLARRLRTFGE